MLSLGLALALGHEAADEKSHRRAAEEFLDLVNWEQTIGAALDGYADQVARQVPNYAGRQEPLRRALRRTLDPATMRQSSVPTLMQAFTEPELRELATFCRTPAGRKLAAKLPELAVQAQGAAARAVEASGQFATILADELEKDKTPQEVADILRSLPNVVAGQRAEMLRKLEAVHGEPASFAIAREVPRLAPPLAAEVRDMLARRLRGTGPADLASYLRDGYAPRELRLAAARAAAEKKADADSRALCALSRRLIAVLGGRDEELAQASAASLRSLTGKDFGTDKTRWLGWLELEWEK
jgi:hypothetical protein